MEPHEELVEWAEAKGIMFDGILPRRLPGRGVGIVATRAIKPDETLVEVPSSCLRTIDTIPKSRLRKLPRDTSVHGLLAADLALEDSDKYAVWDAVCPSPEDFRSMPLLWPAGIQALLPDPAKKLLSKQQFKLARDWAAVSAVFPDLDEDRYRHGWLLANTRTFYYLSPTLRRRAKEDRMVLQPVADLFNHADVGCSVAFDATSFVVRADRHYKPGEEVRICYGRHGGDFLAVEYGFVMDENRWDEASLDEVILPRLGEKWKERLEEKGFLGGYVLDRETVCYRTQVALRTLFCRVREWSRFVDGEDDGASSQGKANELLLEMLDNYRDIIKDRICVVEDMKDGGEECQKALLLQRWSHIDRLVETTIERVAGTQTAVGPE